MIRHGAFIGKEGVAGINDMRLKLWRISIAAGALLLILPACSSMGRPQVSRQENEETAIRETVIEEVDIQTYLDMVCTAGVSAYLAEITRKSLYATSQGGVGAYGYGAEGAPEEKSASDTEEDSWETHLTEYFGYVPSDEELDLLYRTVQAECGYQEPNDGVGAVADVIANRCRSGTFPDTITEVVTQKNQFSTWSNGMIDEAEPSEQVMDVCRSRIEEGVVYSDILFFTAGYYNPYCEPAFVIGHHYFGTEKKL